MKEFVMTNLMEMLWDQSEEGENYECTEQQIQAFIANRIDNDEFSQFERIEFVEVPDGDVDGWVEQFKLWLSEQ
jgi:predicted XRE-type DNA-binding protein